MNTTFFPDFRASWDVDPVWVSGSQTSGHQAAGSDQGGGSVKVEAAAGSCCEAPGKKEIFPTSSETNKSISACVFD